MFHSLDHIPDMLAAVAVWWKADLATNGRRLLHWLVPSKIYRSNLRFLLVPFFSSHFWTKAMNKIKATGGKAKSSLVPSNKLKATCIVINVEDESIFLLKLNETISLSYISIWGANQYLVRSCSDLLVVFYIGFWSMVSDSTWSTSAETTNKIWHTTDRFAKKMSSWEQ